MRIISKRRLREYWESRAKLAAAAQRDLSAWYKLAKGAKCVHFAELHKTFGSVDRVGHCVIFDTGQNRFRLIARMNFAKGIIYVLTAMDQLEYDRNRWREDCGCFRPSAR